MFNKLKGDKTEVSDLRSYEKFRSARLIQEKHFIGYVKNYQSLLTQLKSRPNVSILKSTFIHAELRSAIWNITFISEDSSWARPFSHVIYSDTEVISKCLADGDFRVT